VKERLCRVQISDLLTLAAALHPVQISDLHPLATELFPAQILPYLA